MVKAILIGGDLDFRPTAARPLSTWDDMWKKLNGQWKVLGGTNTSTKPVPPEMYKMETPPGVPPPIS
jgi:hypothetical protein